MASKAPIVKLPAWLSIIPQILFISLLFFLGRLIDEEQGTIYGLVVYFIIFFFLRNLIPKDHRKGMKQVKKGNFAEAIPHFENSYDFFTRNEWIDKYRVITMLSSGKMSYREMALNNIAYCYSQIGNGQQAKAYYERTLQEFPGSVLAESGLRMLESVEEKE
ncbi:tetratricopeptide repeat protein [Chondrinema litorale]|uniref:tetratricopeptide repeat protein n=1 Tax=Chondrinema litorale TaxID=2994555 RepID=UPI002543D9BB|nr:tetratricopeptide repeat protein [Chondrinema litorale]UZR97922.1 tetratricopeptide repeat protein [Chondrinema litorale]